MMTLQMTPGLRSSRITAPASRTRLARADAPVVPALEWERVAVDRYRAHRAGRTVGFVDVVGPVFVVLRGERYDRAEEIAQTLQFGRVGDLLDA